MHPNVTGLECSKELRLAFPAEWRSWKMMWARTIYPSMRDWKWYGAKGIRVEDESWRDFEDFVKAVGPKPEPKHLYNLARRDKNLGYFPENCFWGTTPDRSPGNFQTHCKRGHPLEGDNLFPSALKRGWRRCRACVNSRYKKKAPRSESIAA